MPDVIKSLTWGSLARDCEDEFPASSATREGRAAERWEMARDCMRRTIRALVAWSASRGLMTGADALNLADLIKSVCTDDDMQCVPARDLEDMEQEANAMGEMLLDAYDACGRTDDPGVVREAIEDGKRFDRVKSSAWNHYCQRSAVRT